MTWKHVLVLGLALATMVLCARMGCESSASEIAKLVAVGVIGNAMATPAEKAHKKAALNAGQP